MVLAQIPKQQKSVHERKRHGQHHKSSKHYTKTYWPYLPMLVIVGLGIVVNTLWNGSGVLGYSTDVSPVSLLQATNNNRSNKGDRSLTLNSQLAAAAQAKANDMAKRNYWSHVTPDGKQPWQFVANSGYSYDTMGENLAYGFTSGSAAVSGWMNSQAHRDNMLNPAFQEVGFGIANAPKYQNGTQETIVVAMYGKPAGAVLAATGNSATRPQVYDTDAPQIATKQVSRIDVLTNGAFGAASIMIISLVVLAAIAFAVRHGKAWRKYLFEGEQFVVKHPLLDTIVVAIVTVGFVLTRNTGIIG
jgi:hypothetical protein